MLHLLLLILTLLNICLGSSEHTLIEVTWDVPPEYNGYTHCHVTVGQLFEPPLNQIEGDFYQSSQAKITLVDPKTAASSSGTFVVYLYLSNEEMPAYSGLVFAPQDCILTLNLRHCQVSLKRLD